MAPVSIVFDGMDAFDSNQENVDKIIEEATGNRNYISTKSLPPMIVGLDLSQDAIDKLKALSGVRVNVQGDD